VRRAVALEYDSRAHEAPRVVSTADGDLAIRVELAARECGVPVVRDVVLVDALAELGVGDPIPEELYEVVAAILAEISPLSSDP
jgi:type III secretion system FlhB-like substrate exporter